MHSRHTALLAALICSTAAWGQTITEDFKFLATDGFADDLFGTSIDIQDGIIVVGAVGVDTQGENSGSAYLFDAFTGNQIMTLLPNDGAPRLFFGGSVAIDNAIVAVGAIGDDTNGDRSGCVYLFDAHTGNQIAKILPADGSAEDFFGDKIAISNGILAVGVKNDDDNGNQSGSVYLFDVSTAQQLHKLLPLDGAHDDFFGRSVDIHNDVVAVGAIGDDDNGSFSGSAYLFDAITGDQLHKIVPPQGQADDWFGAHLAIDQNILVVGSHGDDNNGFESGSAYIYSVSTATQIAKLVPDDGRQNYIFGWNVAIDNDRIAISAKLDFNNIFSVGSVYLYDAQTTALITKLKPSDPLLDLQLGHSIAFDKHVLVAGAIHDNDNGIDSGSAYVFDLCPADYNNDNIVNFFDASMFIHALVSSEPSADLNHDQRFDFFDAIVFLSDFSSTCP